MTTDRLAALLHEEMCGSGFPTVHTTHMGDGRVVNTCEWTAARLTAAGVTVAQPAPDLRAAAQAVCDWWDTTDNNAWAAASEKDDALFAALRAALATPQPAEEEGR